MSDRTAVWVTGEFAGLERAESIGEYRVATITSILLNPLLEGENFHSEMVKKIQALGEIARENQAIAVILENVHPVVVYYAMEYAQKVAPDVKFGIVVRRNGSIHRQGMVDHFVWFNI
jgi:hypothetical protein